jgi:hypothetical protein
VPLVFDPAPARCRGARDFRSDNARLFTAQR